MQSAPVERNQEATVFVGDLDPQVNEALLWELFTQVGPVADVHMPRDRVTGSHSGYGFVEMRTREDCEYALRVLSMVPLYGRSVRLNRSGAGRAALIDLGANLFVGNLTPDVDETTLHNTFSSFGHIVGAPRISRAEDGTSKGYGFVSFDCFEASDAAIEAMNGAWLGGNQVKVSYAYKKGNSGERHGDDTERRLAKLYYKNLGIEPQRPNQLFAAGPGAAPGPGANGPVGTNQYGQPQGQPPMQQLVPNKVGPVSLQPQVPHVAPAAAAGGGSNPHHAQQQPYQHQQPQQQAPVSMQPMAIQPMAIQPMAAAASAQGMPMRGQGSMPMQPMGMYGGAMGMHQPNYGGQAGGMRMPPPPPPQHMGPGAGYPPQQQQQQQQFRPMMPPPPGPPSGMHQQRQQMMQQQQQQQQQQPHMPQAGWGQPNQPNQPPPPPHFQQRQ